MPTMGPACAPLATITGTLMGSDSGSAGAVAEQELIRATQNNV